MGTFSRVGTRHGTSDKQVLSGWRDAYGPGPSGFIICKYAEHDWHGGDIDSSEGRRLLLVAQPW